MYNVRTSSQAANGNVEIDLIQKFLAFNGVTNRRVVFQLPKAAKRRRRPTSMRI